MVWLVIEPHVQFNHTDLIKMLYKDLNLIGKEKKQYLYYEN